VFGCGEVLSAVGDVEREGCRTVELDEYSNLPVGLRGGAVEEEDDGDLHP
jgi:hypothetical protein